ncbi:MAG: NfeD family protein, partial [Desulfococcaceae bacterium]
QPKTGADGLIGQSGEVREALSPRGKVFIHGETWNAVSQTPVLPGEVVRVIGVKGLLLEVQPLTPIEMDAGKALGPQGRTPGEPLKKS